MENSQAIQDVQEYYGKVLQSKKDLQTNVCCVAGTASPEVRSILQKVHPEVLEKFYGCGCPIPLVLENCTVLDLGSGSGRDAYIFSSLVGEKGCVIGIDMTDEQLAIANKHKEYQKEQFGHQKSNVDFRKGFIEDLKSAGVEDNSIDIVSSNCVINLSPDKRSVFSEVYRVLKPGGEIYFSDVFAGRRVPQHLHNDPVLRGECLAGAMYIEDFRRLLRGIGFLDYRVVSSSRITIQNPKIEKTIGMVDFYSMTIRAFKVDLEDICENYGHVAYYKGTIPQVPHAYILDDHHVFRTGQPVPVCGNTANMIMQSRLGKHFDVHGSFDTHYGPFDYHNYEKSQNPSGCC